MMIFRTRKQLVSDFSPSNTHVHVNHTQVAWQPLEVPTEKLDFIHGLRTVAGNGTAVSKEGMALHFYVANESMDKSAFVNNDGDFLFVPDQGRLDIQTELGRYVVFYILNALFQRLIRVY